MHIIHFNFLSLRSFIIYQFIKEHQSTTVCNNLAHLKYLWMALEGLWPLEACSPPKTQYGGYSCSLTCKEQHEKVAAWCSLAHAQTTVKHGTAHSP